MKDPGFIFVCAGLVYLLIFAFLIRKTIATGMAIFFWVCVGSSVRLLRRLFPRLGGEYVFFYILILPHYNESSEDSKEINFSVENTGESIHNITVRQKITRQVAVEKETK